MSQLNALNVRITSVDALRAFALFGIIIVHAVGGFCIDTTEATKERSNNAKCDVLFVVKY